MSSPLHGYTKVNKTQGIPTVCLIESGYPGHVSMIWKAVWRHNCPFFARLTVRSATLVDIRKTAEPQNVWEDEEEVNVLNAFPSKLKDSSVLLVFCYWNETYSSNAGRVCSYANFMSKITEKIFPPPPLSPCLPLPSSLYTCLLFLLILLLVSTFNFHGPSSASLFCQFLILLLPLFLLLLHFLLPYKLHIQLRRRSQCSGWFRMKGPYFRRWWYLSLWEKQFVRTGV